MSVCVLGSVNLDVVCRVKDLPGPGETVAALDMAYFPGGKGANQAVASAHWGASTALIAAVGRDEAADKLLAHLVSAGVDISGIGRLANVPTGLAYICVSEAGENSIVVVGGANRAVSPVHVQSMDISRHKVLLSQLETPLDAIETFFGATSRSIRILNGAPALPEAIRLFPLCDILVVNQSELARYAGEANLPESLEAIALVARRLISRGDQSLVVTLGARGALAVDADTFIEVAGRPMRVVDTTGAGDCFCGVLAASLDEGLSITEALFRANAAAAFSTQNAGASVKPTLRRDVQALG